MDQRAINSQVTHIVKFLQKNNDRINYQHLKGMDPNSREFAEKIKMRFRQAVTRQPAFGKLSTIEDPAVAIVLETFKGYTDRQIAEASTAHRDSMGAENLIGNLLELYLATMMIPYGWVWCAGETVKKTDFIKPVNSGFIELQVKNRDNSENSSSSSVRDGTKILKWFRSFSKKRATNWENFPDSSVRAVVSEEGFHRFIRSLR